MIDPRQGTLNFDDPALNYSVVEHPRARNISLKYSLAQGLQVVIPRGYDRRQIPKMIMENREWVEKHQAKVLQQKQRLPADYFSLAPQRIELRALDQTFVNTYQATAHKHIKLHEQHGELLLRGRVDDEQQCAKALQRWLRDKARAQLIPLLRRTSRELGLPYEKTIIRGQKTCWGSCSSKKVISLNYKLLFLPPGQVHYLMVHELCHTRHFNHGKRFWSLVERKMPDYLCHEQAMQEAWQYVPHWADAHVVK